MTPGVTVLTLILSGASSCASARVKPTMPALAVTTCGRRAAPVCALKPPMFTIAPAPERRRCGRQALAQLKAPSRITAVTARHSASVILSKACSARSAALLTRISIRPKCAAAAEVIFSTAAESTTSAMSAMAWPPPRAISPATCSASSRLARALTATAAPPSASESAIARPILRPAPVTMATRPDSSLVIVSPCLPMPALPKRRKAAVRHCAGESLAESGDAIDRNHDRKGDGEHDQAEHGDRTEIARLVEIENEHRDHLGLRCEQHDGG